MLITAFRGCQLWKTRSPKRKSVSHGYRPFGEPAPVASAAVAKIGLNVDPGGYAACVARSSSGKLFAGLLRKLQ